MKYSLTSWILLKKYSFLISHNGKNIYWLPETKQPRKLSNVRFPQRSPCTWIILIGPVLLSGSVFKVQVQCLQKVSSSIPISCQFRVPNWVFLLQFILRYADDAQTDAQTDAHAQRQADSLAEQRQKKNIFRFMKF